MAEEEKTPEQNPAEPAQPTETKPVEPPAQEKPPEQDGDPKKILNELDKGEASAPAPATENGGSATPGGGTEDGGEPQASELVSDAMKRLDELLKKLKSCRKGS